MLTLGSASSDGVDVLLSALKVGQMTSLVVDVEDLLVSGLVEASQLLASRSTDSLLEVGVQAAPASVGLVGDTILGVDGLCLLGCLVLAVESLQGVGEAAADTVLVVKGNCSLDGLIADDVAVCEVLGDDAGTGLIFLVDVTVSSWLIGRANRLATGNLVEGSCGGNVDLSGAKLCVVQEKSSLCSCLLFKGDGSRLSAVWRVGFWSDGDVLNLSTGGLVSCAVLGSLVTPKLTRRRRSRGLPSRWSVGQCP